MKFDTYIQEIVKNNLPIFRKDPCTNAGTRGKNMRARAFRRDKLRARMFTSLVCPCVHGFFRKIF